MALTRKQLKAREGKITASRVAALMTGDKEAILNMWREMVGDPDYVPEDLSGVWAVQLGSCTEKLNLDWYERKHGPVTRRGEVVTMDDWMACTLDGWHAGEMGYPLEAKHVGGWEKMDAIVARYQPQMQWTMLVTGASHCALSVIVGAAEPVVEMIPFDRAYALELRSRARQFLECVRNLTPPVLLEPIPAPIPPEKWKTYDMTGDNVWGSEAAVWLANREASKLCTAAEKQLKTLVPLDAGRCSGNGVVITRSKAGYLSLREDKAA